MPLPSVHADTDSVAITPASEAWSAHHDRHRVDGPRTLTAAGGEVILRDVTFHLDDFAADLALATRMRAFRRSGCAVLQTAGHYPFGGELAMAQTVRYAANHARFTMDLHWRRGVAVKRHLGVGGLFLPGRYRRLYCVPPCLHLAEGRTPYWQDVPEEAPASGMLGHWHRPPAAIVLQRDDGVEVEIGTGSDVWRWERSLGFGPEAGNYKLIQESGGVRVVREPLMTCAEVLPVPSQYRLTWYLAWRQPGTAARVDVPSKVSVRTDGGGDVLPGVLSAAAEEGALVLDLGALPWAQSALRASTPADLQGGLRGASPCWCSGAAQKQARRVVRQIGGALPQGRLVVRGAAPGVCWDPSHCDRKGEPLPHWDMDALLDFAVWTRQHLGPHWEIAVEAPGWEALPSVAGLFAPNGFHVPRDEEDDD